MQFIDLQNDVYAQSGLDSTDSNNQTNVKRWINIVQRDLIGRWPWPFMRGEENIVTVPDYTTGTVSVNAGATSVTGSGTAFASGVGDGTYKIQFGALDWYKVTARGSGTSLTIDTGYAPTTNAVNVAYTLRRMYYPLSANADRILDMKNNNTPIKMFETDIRTLDSVSPDLQATNNSYAYVAWGIVTDSTSANYGNIVIQPYPFPSDARLFWVKTYLRATDMSANTDVSIIPAKWHHVIIFGASALAFMFLRKADIATMWKTEYEAKIEDMKDQNRLSEDDAPVLKSVDSVTRGQFIQMPGQYPIVGSR